jgi:hypothetical protein
LRDETRTVERVTFTRRIFGSWLLEVLLISLTLVIGWLIWLFFTAKNAQSPAKSLTRIYIINVETGRAVGAGEVWLRDVVLKIIVANAVVFGHLIDGAWVLFDRDRQALQRQTDQERCGLCPERPAGAHETPTRRAGSVSGASRLATSASGSCCHRRG